MYRLTDEDASVVSEKPEFGMGYQMVEADIEGFDGRFFIFNSQFAVSMEELVEFTNPEPDEHWLEEEYQDGPVDLQTAIEYWFEEQEQIPFAERIETYYGYRNPAPSRIRLERRPPYPPFFVPSTPFSPIPRMVQTTRQFDGFVRVSRDPNDHRINDDGSVKEETYATTPNDFEHAPNGFSSNGRYALPYRTAARFVYTIVPPRDVHENVVGGTVQPAFNQAGGGVEVMFPDGLPAGSAHPEPYIIPTV